MLRSRAGALSALGRRDPATAIVALGDGEAWVREQAELPSRSRLHAFDLAALRALAAGARGDRFGAVAAIGDGWRHHEQLTSTEPATVVAPRRAQLAALAAR